MTKKNELTKNSIALILSALWVWFCFDKIFLDPRWLKYSVGSVMYGLTIFVVYRLRRAEEGVSEFVLIPIGMAFIAVMFVLWGLTPAVQLPDSLNIISIQLRLSSIFVNGPMVSFLICLLLFYPLTILMPRSFWLVPVVTALLVALLQLDALRGSKAVGSTAQVLLYELLCLALLVPALIWLMGSGLRGRRGYPSDPIRQRKLDGTPSAMGRG